MESTAKFFLSKEINRAKILEVVSTADHFQSYILFQKGQKNLNAKSILSVSTLYGLKGDIVLHALGEDSEIALEALIKSFST